MAKKHKWIGPADLVGILRDYVEQSGSQIAAAEKLGFSATYLSDVMNGRRDAGHRLANKLGYERVVAYVQSEHLKPLAR